MLEMLECQGQGQILGTKVTCSKKQMPFPIAMMEFLTEAAKGGEDYFVSGFQRDFKMSTVMGRAWWLGLFLRVESLTCHIWTGAGSRENSGGKQCLAVAPKDCLVSPLQTPASR